MRLALTLLANALLLQVFGVPYAMLLMSGFRLNVGWSS